MELTVRQIILALAVGVGLAYCEPPLNSEYGVPGNFGGHGNNGVVNSGSSGTVTNSYGAPLSSGHDAHQDYIDSQPKSYEFGYAVKDAASGNDFGRRETSDGDTVRGEYRVQLPDGRTQIVTYTADWRTGFHADVRYEGVASYPDQYNNNNNNNNNNNHNNNGINHNNNNNGYNNGGGGYNAVNINSLDGGGYTGGNNGGYNHNYNGNNGNYNSGYNSNSNNNYDANHNYNGNNNYDSNSLDGSYNYGGYSSNNFGSKTPVSSYGTPAFH